MLRLTADLHQTLVKRQVVHPLWEDSACLSAYIAVTGTSNVRFKEDSIYSRVTLKKDGPCFQDDIPPNMFKVSNLSIFSKVTNYEI